MHRRSIAAFALAAIVLAGCGGDDEKSESSADVERYCALTRQMDAAGEKFFAKLEREGAGEKDFEAAEREFVRRYSAQFDEVVRVAPVEIRGDVRKLIAGVKQRGGLEPDVPVSEDEASAAEERVKAYEKRECAA